MNQAHPIIKRWKNLVEKGERPGSSWYKGEKEDAGKKKHLGCNFILDIEGMRKNRISLGVIFLVDIDEMRRSRGFLVVIL